MMQVFNVHCPLSDSLLLRVFYLIRKNKFSVFNLYVYFCFIDYAKDFDCVDRNKLWKILKEMDQTIWQVQTTWPASWEICMQVRKHQLELDMEQQTGSKLGKECVEAVYCHSASLTYMQNASCEMQG